MLDDLGKSRGFGFVAFEDPETAENACSAMNGKDIEDKAIYVGRAQKRRGKFAPKSNQATDRQCLALSMIP